MTTANDAGRRFYITYDESDGFRAYAEESDRGVWVMTEKSYSLEALLTRCKNRGLQFDGMNRAAIEQVYRWMTVDRPVLEEVERLYEEIGSPGGDTIGFRALADRNLVDE